MTRKLIAPVMMILLGFSAMASAKIMLKEGEKAPNFALMGNDGKTHKLSDFRGEYVVLYFYPAAFTKACTIEAHEFADATDKFAALGATLIGVSQDDIATL
ncbi:MAG TPA: redoxin domain-containing protein, partial [Candidatus Kryptobacter bacterium]|nr:redoxin domain-containing protein [Candidatus Kryptobacter bacterium]